MTSPAMPAPKFATARDLTYPSRGPRQAEFGRIWLRQPFMPWQRMVADVAGELRPDGLPRYRLVVVTLPRQAGKTHLDLAISGERCVSVPRYHAWYTAQTGQDARDNFLKFADENVADTPLDALAHTLRGNGHEVMTFPNKSTIRPHPPTEEKGHGKQSDRNSIDEAWAFSEVEGKALMQALAPAKLTRPGAQTWIWSAGGTAASTWLAGLVARGRAGDPGMAYFEWGIPDDLPLDDLEAIAAHHPAYGHTITLDAIETLRADLGDDAEFARAAGNRWTEVIGGAITAAEWKAARTTTAIPEGAPVGYGAARSEDGTQVAIAVAAQVDDQVVVEILDVLPTAHMAANHVASWAGRDPVAVDPAGPSSGLADDLSKLRVNLLQLTGRETSAAVQKVLDAFEPRAYRYREHPALDAAVKVAGKRRVNDGGYAWARVAAGAPIATLEAATWAVWALTHRPRTSGRQRVITAAA